jgi:hypothetical protein
MNTGKIISWLLLLFSEALIITAFILFKENLADNILVLNIIVSTLIYGLFFVDVLVPWIDFGDKSQRRAGSMGVRWLVTWLYAIAAITVMIAGNYYELQFPTQLIIHGVLLFLLFLGLFGALHASDKVTQVYQTETANRNGIVEMKKAIVSLKDTINDMPDLPESFVKRIDALEENLRFIAPTKNSEAHKLEKLFVETIHAIGFILKNDSLNDQPIEKNLKKCERIYQYRKQIYSN